jgi:hypothetical protein
VEGLSGHIRALYSILYLRSGYTYSNNKDQNNANHDQMSKLRQMQIIFSPMNWAAGMPEKLVWPSGGTKLSDMLNFLDKLFQKK